MATYGHTFTSGDTVTPTKLNAARTVSDIVNADIKSDAAIGGTKVAPDFGAQNVTTTGTVTAAKLIPSGTSATGDGLYLPAANTLALSTNGAERLRIDSLGRAAVGTTDTSTARFTVLTSGPSDAVRITQTGTGNALVVEDSANPDSTPTVIDAAGNVVIGHTSAPTVASLVHPLSVVGVGAAIARAAADAVGSVLTFVKSRSTTIGGARAIVQANDELGAIEFAADNGANLNVLAASISAECDGTPGSADMPGRIVFRTTADGAASPTERMRITNAGNVGIGKTPATALDVNGTVTATAFAGPLTGNVTGSATTLATGRTIALTGDVTGTTGTFNGSANVSAATTIANNAVTTAKIADDAVTFAKVQKAAAAGLSVVGRSAASAGDFAEISAATDGHVLRRSGSSLGFGTIATAGIANDAVTDDKLRNSAALSVIGRSANSTGGPADIAAGTDGHVLRRSGTSLGFGQIATAGIADAAVTDAKIASGVDASKLTTGTLPADRIGSDAITTARINNAAVTAAKLDGAQTGSAPIYGCRAWVNFNGTRNATDTGASTNGANVLIRASGNVASVLKNSAGDYTVTFSTAMPDASFVAIPSVNNPDPSQTTNRTIGVRDGFVKTTSTVRLQALNGLGTAADQPEISVAIFR